MAEAASIVRISQPLADRLESLSARSGRSKTYYANKALEAYLEDAENYESGMAALRAMKRRYSVAEIAADLDVADRVRGQRVRRSATARPASGSPVKKISRGKGGPPAKPKKPGRGA